MRLPIEPDPRPRRSSAIDWVILACVVAAFLVLVMAVGR